MTLQEQTIKGVWIQYNLSTLTAHGLNYVLIKGEMLDIEIM